MHNQGVTLRNYARFLIESIYSTSAMSIIVDGLILINAIATQCYVHYSFGIH